MKTWFGFSVAPFPSVRILLLKITRLKILESLGFPKNHNRLKCTSFSLRLVQGSSYYASLELVTNSWAKEHFWTKPSPLEQESLISLKDNWSWYTGWSKTWTLPPSLAKTINAPWKLRIAFSNAVYLDIIYRFWWSSGQHRRRILEKLEKGKFQWILTLKCLQNCLKTGKLDRI